MARLTRDQKRRKKLTERKRRRRSQLVSIISRQLKAMLTMPAQANPEIERLLEEMPALTTDFAVGMGCELPRSIERKPEPVCQVAQCHANVQRKVHFHGGRPVWGWHFALNLTDVNQPSVDAVFHAVWESPQGELIDITPESKRVMTGWKAGLFIPVHLFCEDKRYFQECEVEEIGNGLLMFRTVQEFFPPPERLTLSRRVA